MKSIGRALLVALALAGCADDDETVDTLDPLASGPSSAGSDVTSADTSLGSPASTAPFEAAGAGTVSIQVRLASSGLEETISLDRSTVDAAELDPISLFASCTALDPETGDGYLVDVTDLRRLTSNNSIVAASLTVAPTVSTPGEYDVTVELAGADQVSTSYSGTVELAAGMSSGTFDAVDEQGNAVSGTFECVASPASTSTTPAPASSISAATSSPPTT